MERACDNCDNPDDELVPVRRIAGDDGAGGPTPSHPTPPAVPDGAGGPDDAADTELWCLSCISLHRHLVSEAG